MEVMTILSSESDPDDPDKGEPEEGDPQTGDPIVNPEDAPDLEDESEEEDEFTQMWGKLGLQPDKGQPNIVQDNWRKIEGRIEVIWQNLRHVIIDAFKEQGRMTCTVRSNTLKEELALVTHMSLLMEQRLELLQSFDTKVELGTEY